MQEFKLVTACTVQLCRFHNIDLYSRGFYQIRCGLKQLRRLNDRVDVTVRKKSRSGVINGNAVSHTFEITYHDETLPLIDRFDFRISQPYQIDKIPSNIELVFSIELYFAEKDYKNIHSGSSFESFKLLSERTLLLNVSLHNGLHCHRPVIFEYGALSAVLVDFHASVIRLVIDKKPRSPSAARKASRMPKAAITLDPSDIIEVGSDGASGSDASPRSDLLTVDVHAMIFGVVPGLNLSETKWNDAFQLHRIAIRVLLAAYEALQLKILKFAKVVHSRIKLHFIDCEKKLEVLHQKSKEVSDSKDFVELFQTDLQMLSTELNILWDEFLNNMFLDCDELRNYLAREHHIQRIKRLGIGCFRSEFNPRQLTSYSNVGHSNSLHAKVADGVRQSEYFARLPNLPVFSTDLDGTAETMPIIFEEKFDPFSNHDHGHDWLNVNLPAPARNYLSSLGPLPSISTSGSSKPGPEMKPLLQLPLARSMNASNSLSNSVSKNTVIASDSNDSSVVLLAVEKTQERRPRPPRSTACSATLPAGLATAEPVNTNELCDTSNSPIEVPKRWSTKRKKSRSKSSKKRIASRILQKLKKRSSFPPARGEFNLDTCPGGSKTPADDTTDELYLAMVSNPHFTDMSESLCLNSLADRMQFGSMPNLNHMTKDPAVSTTDMTVSLNHNRGIRAMSEGVDEYHRFHVSDSNPCLLEDPSTIGASATQSRSSSHQAASDSLPIGQESSEFSGGPVSQSSSSSVKECDIHIDFSSPSAVIVTSSHSSLNDATDSIHTAIDAFELLPPGVTTTVDNRSIATTSDATDRDDELSDSGTTDLPQPKLSFSDNELLVAFVSAKERLRSDLDRIGFSSTFVSELGSQMSDTPYFCASPVSLPMIPDEDCDYHLVICVHGLDGSSIDLRMVRTYLEIGLPDSNIDFLMSQSNQEDTFTDFETMTRRLVDEILMHMSRLAIHPSRISFVGHSLGTLLIRSVLADPRLQPFLEKLHSFLSLNGPHCGVLYNASGLVNMGIWLMQRWKKSASLSQLALKDNADIRQTFLYELSRKPGLEYFKYVLLVGSYQDHYVPMHSAQIQLCKPALKDSSVLGSAYTEMVLNLLYPVIQCGRTTVIRYSAFHALPSGTTNKMIGRAAHIAVLDSDLFIEKLTSVCLLNYFK